MEGSLDSRLKAAVPPWGKVQESAATLNGSSISQIARNLLVPRISWRGTAASTNTGFQSDFPRQ